MSSKLARARTQKQIVKASKSSTEFDTPVVKATRHSFDAPKKKWMDYIVDSINRPDVSFSVCTDLSSAFLARIRKAKGDWVVILKTMVALHRTLLAGPPEFMAAVARGRKLFELEDTFWRTTKNSPFDALAYRYSSFLILKCRVFETVGFYFERENVKTSKRKARSLLEHLEHLFEQLRHIVESRAILDASIPLTRAIIVEMMKDAGVLYKAIAQACIRLLEKYESLKLSTLEKVEELYGRYIDVTLELKAFYEMAYRLLGSEPLEINVPSKQFQTVLKRHIAERKSGNMPIAESVPIFDKAPDQPEIVLHDKIQPGDEIPDDDFFAMLDEGRNTAGSQPAAAQPSDHTNLIDFDPYAPNVAATNVVVTNPFQNNIFY